MARGRDGAHKKSETSSSVSKGRVWEVPSQKEKTGFKSRLILKHQSRTAYRGGLVPVPGISPRHPAIKRNRRRRFFYVWQFV